MNYSNAVQNLSNLMPVVSTMILLYAVCTFAGLLDSSRRIDAATSRLTSLEVRVANSNEYHETRHNNLNRHVDEGFAKIDQKLQILEARQQAKP